MIVNNGMKGALIRNAGLPGQYLEDLPPDDGSQRLYNLMDYSARFGGIADITGGSIILEGGMRVSLYEYLKDTEPLHHSGTFATEFDDSAGTVTFTRSSVHSHDRSGVAYPLPEGYQSLSFVYKVLLQPSPVAGSAHCPLRLLSWADGYSAGANYNVDTFVGTEFYKNAGTTAVIIRPNVGVYGIDTPPAEGTYDQTEVTVPGVTGTVYAVSFIKRNELAKIHVNGKETMSFRMYSPDALFFGFAVYAVAVSYALGPFAEEVL